MSALSPLLERLRRIQPPPGAAAGVVAVPSAGDELSGEVAFLFGPLDEIETQSELTLSSARSAAAKQEAAAVEQRHRLLEDADADAQRIAAELLSQRRVRAEQQARALLAGAEREAQRVTALGRERTPALVSDVIQRLLEGGP